MVNNIIKSPDLISKQLCDRFMQEIRSGKYGPNQALPSYSALARAYGISKSTVHEAFKVLAAQGFLYIKHGKGAFVNPAKIDRKRVPALRDVAVVAFNVFSASDNYMIPFLEAVNGYAVRKKINLHFHFIRGMSVLDPDNAMLKDAVAHKAFQGLLIASPLDLRDIQWLVSLKVPFVAATSRYGLDIPQVCPDNALAVSLAADLFKQAGARRVAVFTGPLSWQRENITPFAREIYDAFEAQKKKNGLDVTFVHCEYNYADARRKALDRCFTGRPFEGLFFQSDIIAKGVQAAFCEKGADLSQFASVNYCDLEEYIAPLNVRKPLHAMGREAVRLLDALYQGRPVEDRSITVKPETILPGRKHG
jgi:DNA-binding LacI/PurR family transcriptional regulator